MSTPNHNPALSQVDHAARLAHELANLLDGSMRNVVLARALMTDHDAGQPATAQESGVLQRLQTAEQGMRQMAALLKRWLSDRPDAAQLHESGQTLGELIRHTCDLHQPAAKALGIDLIIDIGLRAEKQPAGPVAPILANALRNAIEAISGDGEPRTQGGAIEVAAQWFDGSIRLSIADNGPGLSPQVLDLGGVFRPGKTTKPGGHGLGLALVKDIVDTLGGTMRLSNREPHGAVLTVTYPLESLKIMKSGNQEIRKSKTETAAAREPA